MRVKTFEGLQEKSTVYYTADGFYYHKNRVMNGGRLSLVCTLRRKGACPGRASCNRTGREVKVTTPHNHAGDRLVREQKKLRKAILARCKTKDPSAFHEIVEQESYGYSRNVRAANDHITLRSAMRRARLHRYPKIPQNLTELGKVLRRRKNRNITASRDGTQNLLFAVIGSFREKTRSIIFMTKRQQRHLRRAKKLFADGTWDSRPSKPDSRQVFNICTSTRDKRCLPLATVLMQSKSQRSYVKVLSTLRDAGCNPRVVHTDFEAAQYNAWKSVFGRQLKVDGCLYHFTVRLREKAKKLGLSQLLRENELADSIVRSCNALPLLPRRRIRGGFETIRRRAQRNGLYRVLRTFFHYVEKTWLSRTDILSICHSEDRTNNISESFNNTLNLAVKLKRPNVWLFIDALVKLEDRFAQDLYRLRHGLPVNRLRKASAVRNDRRIRELTRNLLVGHISMTDFLKNASMRMQNVWRPVYGHN